jgi:crossover junction endodeoxyribonuclease RuvC
VRFAAFDPGITGAIALMDHGRLTDVMEMPTNAGRTDGGQIAVILGEFLPDQVIVENTQPMPKNGSIASYSLGLNTGIILGVVQAMAHPLVRVRPQEWKKGMGLYGKSKDDSRMLAIELYPEHAAKFRRKKDDGLAEAALIARWATAQAIYQANQEPNAS